MTYSKRKMAESKTETVTALPTRQQEQVLDEFALTLVRVFSLHDREHSSAIGALRRVMGLTTHTRVLHWMQFGSVQAVEDVTKRLSRAHERRLILKDSDLHACLYETCALVFTVHDMDALQTLDAQFAAANLVSQRKCVHQVMAFEPSEDAVAVLGLCLEMQYNEHHDVTRWCLSLQINNTDLRLFDSLTHLATAIKDSPIRDGLASVLSRIPSSDTADKNDKKETQCAQVAGMRERLRQVRKGECAVCQRAPLRPNKPWKQCARCKLVPYCSRACQAADWKEHKPVCAMLAVVSHHVAEQVDQLAGGFEADANVKTCAPAPTRLVVDQGARYARATWV